MLKVKLVAHTPNPEKVVASAAKLCYAGCSIDELMNNLDEKKSKEFVKKLSSMGHESPIEHVSFTFAIEGVSRALLAQITRHRIASFSVQSQRYVRMDDFKYVIPPAVLETGCEEEFVKIMDEQAKQYLDLVKQLEDAHYKSFSDTKNGDYEKDEKARRIKASKIANEDARFILPNACETKMIVTMNARSLLNFFNHRCCNRAQWEIHALADEMLKLVYKEAPTIFLNAGPSCVSHPCPEGTMTCGKCSEVRKNYKDLKNSNEKEREVICN